MLIRELFGTKRCNYIKNVDTRAYKPKTLKEACEEIQLHVSSTNHTLCNSNIIILIICLSRRMFQFFFDENTIIKFSAQTTVFSC